MIIQASKDGFGVADRDDFRTLSVQVGDLDHEGFMAAVRASADVAPHETPRHLWVSVDLLRRELDIENDPRRAAALAGMLRAAETAGWLSSDGTRIAAHIVVPDGV